MYTPSSSVVHMSYHAHLHRQAFCGLNWLAPSDYQVPNCVFLLAPGKKGNRNTVIPSLKIVECISENLLRVTICSAFWDCFSPPYLNVGDRSRRQRNNTCKIVKFSVSVKAETFFSMVEH